VPEGDASSTPPTLGAGIDNARIYLLNEDRQRVPTGKTGEIFIGGSNVGRGYRKQPDLTEKCFVRDPFSRVSGARMYRSGDLGALLPTGEIQFQGRVDQQQSIRGHRVEPDEVAGVLARHPEVSSCAVKGHGDVSNRKLTAYVVPRPGTRPEPKELREFLRTQVPEYMIPSAFVRLQDLPLDSHGKLDLAALPDPGPNYVRQECAYRAPGTPLEQNVADMVSALMGLEQVGMDDTFFSLGCHSLLGTQLALQIREKFGVELTMRHVFEAQTVGKLADQLDRLLRTRIECLDETGQPETARAKA
jgi:acyl carrier protein